MPFEREFVYIGENSVLSSSNPLMIENRSYGQLDIKELVWQKYPDWLRDLIQCESGWNNNICGDNGTSCGILQYKKATFDLYCQGEWFNPEDQIICATQMIGNGLGKTHWTNCWIKMGLDRYF